MKTILFFLTACILVPGCIVNATHTPAYSSGTESVNKERYTILEEKKSKARFNRFWILFFPFGGKNPEKREAKALAKMMKETVHTGTSPYQA